MTIICREKWPCQSASHCSHIHMYISCKGNTWAGSFLPYLAIMYTGLFVQGVGDPNVIFSLCIGSSDFHQLLSTGIATSQVIPELKKIQFFLLWRIELGIHAKGTLWSSVSVTQESWHWNKRKQSWVLVHSLFLLNTISPLFISVFAAYFLVLLLLFFFFWCCCVSLKPFFVMITESHWIMWVVWPTQTAAWCAWEAL